MRISDWSSDVCSSDLLQALDDDLLALLEALDDRYPAALRTARANAALLGLSFLVDDAHVRPCLVDGDRRLRDDARLLGPRPLDDHADELVIHKKSLGIGYGREENHRVGRRLDLDVDAVDLSGPGVDR